LQATHLRKTWPPSNDEIQAVLRYAKASRDRDWLMILVGFWHGLRASEVVAITAGSIVDGHLTVARLKGSNKTVQPLVTHADPLLDEAKGLFDYALGMHINQKLFPISRVRFYRLFHRYAMAASESAAIPTRASRAVVAVNERGRRIGETHHNALISDALVDEMRGRHEDDGLGYRKISREFNVALTTVRKICTYERRAQTAERWKTIRVRKAKSAVGFELQKKTVAAWLEVPVILAGTPMIRGNNMRNCDGF
jgi:hypothetical protein